MTRLFFLLVLVLSNGCGHAGTYLIEAAPEPQGKSTIEAERIFVAPFKDARRNRDLYKGRAEWEAVYVDVAGSTLLASAWRNLKSGDISYLWHRQLAYQLSDQGYAVSAAAQPLTQNQAVEAAKLGGSDLVMEGEIKKLYIDKRGADMFLGTNLSGTNYNFKSQASVRLKEAGTGKVKFSKEVTYEHIFYSKDMLGSEDRETFPVYFATGLIGATRAFGEDPDLRKAAGVPTCTVTPTATITPEIKQAKPGEPATVAVATPTPIPAGPYWINPKTDKRMNPDWKFDPEDGTPRSEFILRNPSK